jgi:hypothetical protein
LQEQYIAIASISLSFDEINTAIAQGKFADTIQEAEADRGAYRIELSWGKRVECVYAPVSTNNCPA